jgi:hypothetical protein
VLGWLIGFMGFAIHVSTNIEGSIPVGFNGDARSGGFLATDVERPVKVKIYGWTVHEETGPVRVVFPSCDRLANWIAWPTVAVCIGIGAAGGVYLGRVLQARTKPSA